MFSLINVDKPAGLTSRDVVNRVQRLVKPNKVGHAGTLDPLATGVLVIAIGQATRLVEYVQRMRKTYRGTFLLGRTSSTEDIDGDVTELQNPVIPTDEQVRAAIPSFLGTIQQKPPGYSAVKLAGQRAYKLARRGESVELAPRPVEIHALEIIRYAWPELELRIECGSGTYVRSLARDLARSLGTGAVMSALRRLAIGPLRADDALLVDDLSLAVIHERRLPATVAVGVLPQVVVDGDEAARLAKGQTILNRFGVNDGEIAAVSGANRLVAILAPAGRLELRPMKCFAS